MRANCRSDARGQALVLVMVALFVLVGLAALVGNRMADRFAERRDAERRNQAMWLARSAASLAQSGERTVTAGGEKAKVRTRVSAAPGGRRVESEAVVGRHTAQVEAVLGADGTAVSWTERANRTDP
jgi:type II secretory pathway component PulK